VTLCGVSCASRTVTRVFHEVAWISREVTRASHEVAGFQHEVTSTSRVVAALIDRVTFSLTTPHGFPQAALSIKKGAL